MKDIKGYEGKYAVTEDGWVWSYKRQKFLSPRINNQGYYRVALCKDGEVKDFYIHRLVAEAYLDKPEGKDVVNHKDENPKNNNVSNLMWATQKENMNWGTFKERMSKAVYCVELDQTFTSQAEAAKVLGVSKVAVNNCVNGRTQTCCGYHLKKI